MESTIARRQAFSVRWLVLLFALAAGVRVGWVVVRFHAPLPSSQLSYPDEEAYWRAGRSLAAGDGLVDEFGYRATYMPAYPFFLSLFARTDRPLFWARMAQAVLGALAAPLTFLLARRWVAWARDTTDRYLLLAAVAAVCLSLWIRFWSFSAGYF